MELTSLLLLEALRNFGPYDAARPQSRSLPGVNILGNKTILWPRATEKELGVLLALVPATIVDTVISKSSNVTSVRAEEVGRGTDEATVGCMPSFQRDQKRS